MTPPKWHPLDPGRCERHRDRYWTLFAILLMVSVCLWLFVLASGMWPLLPALILTTIPLIIVCRLAERQNNFVKAAIQLNLINGLCQKDIPFVLFLRSFSSELRQEHTHCLVEHEYEETRIIQGEIFETGRKRKMLVKEDARLDDLVERLIQLCNEIPLVVIDGRPSELSVQPLTVLSDDADWRAIYQTLAKFAAVILILPEPSLSLKSEIESALAQYREKLAFLMPPTRESVRIGTKSSIVGATRATRWAEVCSQLPIGLPNYASSGALLLPTRTPNQFESLSFAAKDFRPLLDRKTQGANTLRFALIELQARGLLQSLHAEMERRACQLPVSMVRN